MGLGGAHAHGASDCGGKCSQRVRWVSEATSAQQRDEQSLEESRHLFKWEINTSHSFPLKADFLGRCFSEVS